MKVGLFITNQQRLETDMVSALDEQYAMVRLARDKGWDSLFTGQHYLNEGDNQQLQIVPFLARLQAEAGEMTLGLGILLINLHNPVYVAETVATMDVLCRGNFVFGIGLGYRETEFDAFRVPKGQRVRRFEECLELVKRLVDGRGSHLGERRVQARRRAHEHPPRAEALSADLGGGEQRQGHRARRAHRRQLVHQPPFDHGDHQAPDGALPGGTGPVRQAVSGGFSLYEGGFLQP